MTRITLTLITLTCLLASCSYNPLNGNNHTTGSGVATISGAAIGVGVGAMAGGNKPVLGLAGLAGGAIGYYTSTLRYDAGGIYHGGGQVYQVGEFLGIYIPTDKVFEPNTADFLPSANPILDSAATVLRRFPDHNILISGNTSGFGRAKREQKLSEKRAERVAAYLWNAGLNDFKNQSIDLRRLRYVGYGDYLPNSSHLTNNGIRADSFIQITSYPTTADLRLDARHLTMNNIGETQDDPTRGNPEASACGNNGCYKD